MLQDEWEEIVPIPQLRFKGHPPLGVNATAQALIDEYGRDGFKGHPPLGVNATKQRLRLTHQRTVWFQRAPTLGGECYRARWRRFGGHRYPVSKGTHPWG